MFSNVFGDYTKERSEFELKANVCYERFGDMVNVGIALQSSFLVAVLSEYELSELTHQMNIWKSQERFIIQGCSQVPLHESDFNESDRRMIITLGNMYPVEMIKASEVLRVGNSYFVPSKSEITRLTEEHFDVLAALSEKEELHNPVYLEIDDEGVLLVD